MNNQCINQIINTFDSYVTSAKGSSLVLIQSFLGLDTFHLVIRKQENIGGRRVGGEGGDEMYPNG